MRRIITDEIWAVFGPMAEECRSPLGPEPQSPDRMSFEAVPYRARTGIPWRDLPGEFGARDAVYNRPRRWIRSGRLKRRFERMEARPECDGPRRLMIDSTVVRAHQHAAGGPGKAGAPRRRRSGGRGAGSRPRSSPSRATRTA